MANPASDRLPPARRPADAALIHHDDAVRHGHGFLAVMRDMQHREAEPALQRLDFGTQLQADLGVEIAQRLVEQQEPRLDRKRAAERDALALPAREVRHLAIFQSRHVQHREDLADARPDFRARRAAQPQAVTDIAQHRHVRPER